MSTHWLQRQSTDRISGADTALAVGLRDNNAAGLPVVQQLDGGVADAL